MSTPARKSQLIADLREHRDALYLAVERLPDAELTRPLFARGRERSSVSEELIHFANAEASYRAWIERARVADGAEVRGEPPPDAELDADDAASYTARELVDVLAAERRETLSAVRQLEPADFLRTVQAPGGALSVDELVAALARHDRHLTNAIARGDGTLLPRFYSPARSSGLERA